MLTVHPYEGSFKVMQAGDKTFTIDRGGRKEVISVDRLKPAFVDLEHPVAVSEPKNCGLPPNKDRLVIPNQPQERTEIADPVQPRRTKSGHQVNLPRRYISVLGGSGVEAQTYNRIYRELGGN